MIICILAGVLLGIAERLILNATAEKAGQAECFDVSLILYRGTAVRVVTVIGGLVLGAIILNKTMFICLVVSYVMTRLAIMFASLRNLLVRKRRCRKQQES